MVSSNALMHMLKGPYYRICGIQSIRDALRDAITGVWMCHLGYLLWVDVRKCLRGYVR